MSYDTWKLQTPEEYFGAVMLRCEQCGDDFDTYRDEDLICQECEEENEKTTELANLIT